METVRVGEEYEKEEVEEVFFMVNEMSKINTCSVFGVYTTN